MQPARSVGRCTTREAGLLDPETPETFSNFQGLEASTPNRGLKALRQILQLLDYVVAVSVLSQAKQPLGLCQPAGHMCRPSQVPARSGCYEEGEGSRLR